MKKNAGIILNQDIDFQAKKETPSFGNLIERDKKLIHLGWFDRPFSHLNLEESFHPPFKGTHICPHLRSVIKEKSWHFFSFTSDRYTVGLAIVHTGYASSFFLYAYDFETKKYAEVEETFPFSKRVKMAANSLNGVSAYQSQKSSIVIENHLGPEVAVPHHWVSFHCQGKVLIKGRVKVTPHGLPLVNSREVEPSRIVYTHQNSMNRPEGVVVWDGQTIEFRPDRDFSTMDFTVGHHAYKTTWNWASAGGVSEDGTPVAINLAADIREGGTNDVAVFWLGKDLYRVPKVQFQYPDTTQTWSIKSPPAVSSGESAIDLTFVPQGKRKGNISVLGIIESRFEQPFGTYSGTLTSPSGLKVHIKDMKGVAEEHFAKW